MSDVVSRQEVKVLVLSRKKWERIVIGGGIWLTVLEIRGTCVRLHIYPAGVELCDVADVHQDQLDSEERAAVGETQANGATDLEQQAAAPAFSIPPHPYFDGCEGHEIPCWTDDQFVLDGDIVITIVEIRPDKVRIGFEAPIDVEIHRKEVYERKYRNPAPPESEFED